MPDYDELARALRKPLAPYFHAFSDLDLGRGTAMPTTGHDGAVVQAGARFWRTDLGFAAYYDGARWLTIADYPYVVLPWQTFTASNTYTDIVIRTDYAIAVTRVVTATNVAATNDATNYWNIVIAGINTARSASSTIEIFSTVSDAAGVETMRDNVPNSSTLPSNRTYIRCVGTKTGAPGNMTIAHTIYTKLVIP